MKVYLLISMYPYQGGYIHGVFSDRKLAEKHGRLLEEEEEEEYIEEIYIEEIELDKFEPNHVYVG